MSSSGSVLSPAGGRVGGHAPVGEVGRYFLRRSSKEQIIFYIRRAIYFSPFCLTAPLPGPAPCWRAPRITPHTQKGAPAICGVLLCEGYQNEKNISSVFSRASPPLLCVRKKIGFRATPGKCRPHGQNISGPHPSARMMIVARNHIFGKWEEAEVATNTSNSFSSNVTLKTQFRPFGG